MPLRFCFCLKIVSAHILKVDSTLSHKLETLLLVHQQFENKESLIIAFEAKLCDGHLNLKRRRSNYVIAKRNLQH